MAFTAITVTGTFTRADGQAATGKITATLSAQMRNATQIVDPTAVYGMLNAAGQLKDDTAKNPLTLEANDDPGTTPTGPTASYLFDLDLDVNAVASFSAVISHLAPGGTVDISTLMP